ncbi:MAG: hydrogenase maturation nickel metallochaperone HypA [Xanthobacteraceae bacterium]|jgi:hydrogenase nickel incorporation protein HypA/HybF
MHELGITRNIVAIVGDAAGGRRVSRVTVEIGKLSGVMAEAVAFCFEVVASGTGLDGATLEIREIEGRARCLACGGEFAVHTLYAPCSCGSRRIVVLAGEELKIKTMELEETA